MIQWRGTFERGSEVHHRLEDWRRTRTTLPLSYDYLYEKRAVIGTPESCAAKIRDFQQQGIEYFICNFAFGGMEHGKVLRSMELFAKEVMPQFV
jgi:alkanesulfonate monooxygenase SsuD/methylene tetrahydromethanopterin reductase-like flavin-dependent oxidoreductase (luciferase family)